jgi:hypothetical protein
MHGTVGVLPQYHCWVIAPVTSGARGWEGGVVGIYLQLLFARAVLPLRKQHILRCKLTYPLAHNV